MNSKFFEFLFDREPKAYSNRATSDKDLTVAFERAIEMMNPDNTRSSYDHPDHPENPNNEGSKEPELW